jgi:hypothetical protein
MTTETGFNQVYVWPGCIVGKDLIQDFEDTMSQEFGVKVKYIEEIETTPDMKNGEPVPETGGRIDLFFFIHDDDIPKFSLGRLAFGIRWVEDVIDNMKDNFIYPERVKEYRKW